MSRSAKATDLREQRARLILQGREVTDAAEAEGRDFTAEEDTKYAALWADINSLDVRAKRLDREAAAAAEMDAVEGRASRDAGTPGEPASILDRVAERWRPAMRAFASAHPEAANAEYHAAFRTYLAEKYAESRALSAGDDGKGGYLVPADFMADLAQKTRDSVVIEAFATTYQLTTGDSVGRPTVETNPADADWTSEIATGSEDTATAFGSRELNPHPLAKRIKISRKLLRSAAFSVEAIVADLLAYKFGVSREKAFLTGDGAGQPLGLFTASADGITTARDYLTDNTTTAVTFNGLKGAMWQLKEGYRRNARWLFHRDALAMIDKLKDGESRYLLQPDVRAGTGDIMFGLPVMASEYAPNTFTAGNYVGIVGDFSHYWIADALTFTVQRLDELYAETNQVGYIGRAETDAMPVFAEAFTRVQLALS